MKKCPLCEGKLAREERTILYTYKETTKDIVQSADYCVECVEGFLSPKDLKIS